MIDLEVQDFKYMEISFLLKITHGPSILEWTPR
jgi:hypothetical protein